MQSLPGLDVGGETRPAAVVVLVAGAVLLLLGSWVLLRASARRDADRSEVVGAGPPRSAERVRGLPADGAAERQQARPARAQQGARAGTAVLEPGRPPDTGTPPRPRVDRGRAPADAPTEPGLRPLQPAPASKPPAPAPPAPAPRSASEGSDEPAHRTPPDPTRPELARVPGQPVSPSPAVAADAERPTTAAPEPREPAGQPPPAPPASPPAQRAAAPETPGPAPAPPAPEHGPPSRQPPASPSVPGQSAAPGDAPPVIPAPAASAPRAEPAAPARRRMDWFAVRRRNGPASPAAGARPDEPRTERAGDQTSGPAAGGADRPSVLPMGPRPYVQPPPQQSQRAQPPPQAQRPPRAPAPAAPAPPPPAARPPVARAPAGRLEHPVPTRNADQRSQRGAGAHRSRTPRLRVRRTRPEDPRQAAVYDALSINERVLDEVWFSSSVDVLRVIAGIASNALEAYDDDPAAFAEWVAVHRSGECDCH